MFGKLFHHNVWPHVWMKSNGCGFHLSRHIKFMLSVEVKGVTFWVPFGCICKKKKIERERCRKTKITDIDREYGRSSEKQNSNTWTRNTFEGRGQGSWHWDRKRVNEKRGWNDTDGAANWQTMMKNVYMLMYKPKNTILNGL